MGVAPRRGAPPGARGTARPAPTDPQTNNYAALRVSTGGASRGGVEIAFAASPAANNSRIDTPANTYGCGRSWLSEADEADMDASWGLGQT